MLSDQLVPIASEAWRLYVEGMDPDVRRAAGLAYCMIKDAIETLQKAGQ